MLLSRDQRYNSESKSQPLFTFTLLTFSCYHEIKDTILKANHNLQVTGQTSVRVVIKRSKIQF